MKSFFATLHWKPYTIVAATSIAAAVVPIGLMILLVAVFEMSEAIILIAGPVVAFIMMIPFLRFHDDWPIRLFGSIWLGFFIGGMAYGVGREISINDDSAILIVLATFGAGIGALGAGGLALLNARGADRRDVVGAAEVGGVALASGLLTGTAAMAPALLVILLQESELLRSVDETVFFVPLFATLTFIPVAFALPLGHVYQRLSGHAAAGFHRNPMDEPQTLSDRMKRKDPNHDG
ncbi:hypothetical protein [Stratiformator vulcanicus]|uniref:Uncharacterized protein n=1 Tax=Stratiformator vulcanicus TaxID=2527980 RepID=A0A517QYW3_9PLAN|nr:hypothetical protein [Stratiformator vulcanicus]QDT36836.1 hypothetical protein Pan189_11990 [Stratiformator vulcanicus]